MSHWNHRVLKQTLPDGTEWYTVREVYYNDDGSIFAYTERPVEIAGESLAELRQEIEWILACLDQEMLIEGEVEFVDDENELDDSAVFHSIDDLWTAISEGSSSDE
jgi:hypothetical protein